MTSASRINPSIDNLRHIFAIAVILMHMHSLSRYSLATNLYLSSLVNWIDGAVIGFFFISGYLYKHQSDIFDYVKKQAVKLLIPFIFFLLIYTFTLGLLGKLTIQQGLIETVTLHGAGMQLYFLPYLLIVTVCFAIFSQTLPVRYQLYFELTLLVSVALISIALPTIGSAGSEYKLLPLYLLGFILGKLCRRVSHSKRQLIVLLGVVIACLLIGLIDSRFFDVAGVVVLFLVFNQFSNSLPSKRLPGSGGVYLLHTPIVNFTLSSLLLQLGVSQIQNLFASVFLTYLFCLLFTLFCINKMPNFKWLLLE